MKRVNAKEDKECWFCYDNPSIDRDLILWDKGKYFYVAAPKGSICDEHFLIVPKQHIAHSLELDEQQEEEYLKVKKFLMEYISNQKHMDFLFFERNAPFKFQKAAHMNS